MGDDDTHKNKEPKCEKENNEKKISLEGQKNNSKYNFSYRISKDKHTNKSCDKINEGNKEEKENYSNSKFSNDGEKAKEIDLFGDIGSSDDDTHKNKEPKYGKENNEGQKNNSK